MSHDKGKLTVFLSVSFGLRIDFISHDTHTRIQHVELILVYGAVCEAFSPAPRQALSIHVALRTCTMAE